MEKKNIKQMKTKQDLIQYCLTLRDVYEDYPFRDQEWALYFR